MLKADRPSNDNKKKLKKPVTFQFYACDSMWIAVIYEFINVYNTYVVISRGRG